MNKFSNNKNLKKYIICLYVFLIVAVMAFMLGMYNYYQDVVPSTISIKAGTSAEINLNIPASGVVGADSENVVALNQPLTLIAGEGASSYQMSLKLFGVVPLKNVDIQVIEETYLTPVGRPIGIYVKTQGVLVVDTGQFTDIDGRKVSPSKEVLLSGDYLTAMDGIAITGKKQVREYVENSNGKEICFQVIRQDEVIKVNITPQMDESSTFKMGAWLRDNAQGIGTMTYIDSNNRFGALGHGVNDTDTGELLKLGTGLLYHTDIVAIKKGLKGNPGELTGVIEYVPENVSGIIVSNSQKGIYGVANDELLAEYTQLEPIPIALKQEVRTGDAMLLCQINGKVSYYDIEITKISLQESTATNRRLSVKVTDPDLIELTGGIVQGMSGAPIIQDGKFVGAITHVLVQDSTKGYGIFIEDMLLDS